MGGSSLAAVGLVSPNGSVVPLTAADGEPLATTALKLTVLACALLGLAFALVYLYRALRASAAQVTFNPYPNP